MQTIVIVGGGTAGWMTAAALSHLLPPSLYQITLVESDQIGTVGVGEATIPHIRAFNQLLGIPERAFLQATQATFKTAINFRNWGRIGNNYYHPFGCHGSPLAGLPFHQCWFKAKAQGYTTELGAFSLPVAAAAQGRFATPLADPRSIYSTYSYAYHLDASRYADYLRQFSIRRQARRVEGKIDKVELCNRNGHIRSVMLESGETLHGDLFIDCSGFRALLMEKCLNVGFEDWSHWLPCDRAVAAATETTRAPLPYTQSIAGSAGWQWRIPLQHRNGNGHVYCSAYLSDDAAAQQLLDDIDGKPLSDPRVIPFKAGVRKKSWYRNCIAIGLSSGFLEPLESTSIYLIQMAIYKLLELLPDQNSLAQSAQEFNRLVIDEYEKVRDFLILHYHANSRTDSDFWRYCRTMSIPDSLADRMSLFKNQSHIATYTNGLFMEPSWLAVYAGQDVVPQKTDPRLERFPPAQLIQHLDRLAGVYRDAVAKIPDHQTFLTQFLHDNSDNPQSAPASMSLYGGPVT